jgi:hypothetical protein
VFTNSKMINQVLLPRRADFHNARPFHIRDQIIKKIISAKGTPGNAELRISSDSNVMLLVMN